MEKGRFADGDWTGYATGDGSATATPITLTQVESPLRPMTGLPGVQTPTVTGPNPAG